ncbi:MAG: T9SS type A sorting domain-containing protein [Caldisericum exile]|uniref:T9SS type A sorting domain-containing protein n=1 Tax=Caldisericum exile TaxID=693075 RepID=UPI003C70A7F5
MEQKLFYIFRKNQLLSIFLLLLLVKLSSYSQTIVWEKTYREPALLSSAFDRIILSKNTSSLYGIGYGLRGDTSFILIAKFNENGDMLFYKRYYKIIGGKLKRVFLGPTKIDTSGHDEFITAVSLLSIYGSFEYFAGFWLYITKFDSNGNLIFEGLDTTSKHTVTMAPEGTGPILELNNSYYNFCIYKDTILLKKFSLNGNFISETKLGKVGLSDNEGGYYYWGSYLIHPREDTSFFFILNHYVSPVTHSYLIKISKDFVFEWIKPIEINNDTVSTGLIHNKEDRMVAYSYTKRDSTHYLVEIDINGAVTAYKNLNLDKRLIVNSIRQISDGGYLLFGKIKFNKPTEVDSSCYVIAKISKNYEVEQLFYGKCGNMPWGVGYLSFLELPDHTFYISGYYDYYPYLAKMKDIVVSVENDYPIDRREDIVVEEYLYLKDISNKPVSVYNVLGEKVMETIADQSINVKHLAKGLYYMKIGDKIFKFIKI